MKINNFSSIFTILLNEDVSEYDNYPLNIAELKKFLSSLACFAASVLVAISQNT